MQYQCKFCKRTFETKNGLASHLNWHNPAFRNNNIKKRSGENSSSWKGKKVGYMGLHYRMRKYKKKPLFCENCGKKKKLEITNKSGKYLTTKDDWEWLCRKCHMKKDSRLKKLNEYGKNKKIKMDIDLIKKMYIKQKKSGLQIAKEMNLSYPSLLRNYINKIKKGEM